MIDTIYIRGLIASIFIAMHIQLIYKYFKTKARPSLYIGITSLLWAAAGVFGTLIGVATLQYLFTTPLTGEVTRNFLSLTTFFYRVSITLGMLGYLFLNAFAISMTKPNAKMKKIWIPFSLYLFMLAIIWANDPVPEGVNVGTLEFTLTSMYKVPYGLPLIETILALTVMLAIYPVYLFFHIALTTKEQFIKVKSILMGIGMLVVTQVHAIEFTNAISYLYMPFYRPFILVGSSILYIGYAMPSWLQRKIVEPERAKAELVRSFVEEFFVSTRMKTADPVKPTGTFAKTLGLKYKELVGRKLLLEFDPASAYEKTIQDFANDSLTNAKPIIVFTRRGSALHSSLRELKAVKFFCLTQQVSGPREFSENEMLLPLTDTSLMLDVFDKTSKAHPEGEINIVFDSLSDLVLSIGFEKTYYFVRYATELLAHSRITALFLLNQTAHDPKVASSLRGLFSNHVSMGKDGIQAVKLPKAELCPMEIEKAPTKEGM